MIPRSRNYALSLFTLALAVVLLAVPEIGQLSTTFSSEPTDQLSPTERELVQELNVLRSDPPKYAIYLEQAKKYYRGKDYKPPGQAMALTTVEGVAAVDEAIRALRATKPLTPYNTSTGMCLAAKDHVTDIVRTGSTGHKGTDGSTTEARVNRYGQFSNGIAENILYDTSGAREAVIGWLIDDGVPSRGHRRNLLSPNYRYLGVGVGARSNISSMCVLTFAGTFVEAKAAATGKSKAVRKM
jgi:uncharacterized protein YkwD